MHNSIRLDGLLQKRNQLCALLVYSLNLCATDKRGDCSSETFFFFNSENVITKRQNFLKIVYSFLLIE